MNRFFLVFGIALLSFFSLFAPVAFSANECTVIYGGGEIDCKATITATAKVTPSPTRSLEKKPATESGQTSPSANAEQTTKGGLPVYEPTKADVTPPTGPEALALVTLIPAAALGFYLRKKTK